MLDADITLTSAGLNAALLQLVGVYRPGPGEAGRRAAPETVAAFLTRIAYEIICLAPAGTEVPA